MIEILDMNPDDSFGYFFGHPEGPVSSHTMISQRLVEVNLSFKGVQNIIGQSIESEYTASIDDISQAISGGFVDAGWIQNPLIHGQQHHGYYGLEMPDSRWALAAINLNNAEIAIGQAYFMDRLFRSSDLRLGIIISMDDDGQGARDTYTRLISDFDYLRPQFPLWLIGLG